MAWIEFHPTRIKRLQKFVDLRSKLDLSEAEMIGALGLFWGEVMDLREDGDITGWTAVYITDRMGIKRDPDLTLGLLLDLAWIDVRAGRSLVHDWLDYAGRYLIVKYSKDKTRLESIWAVHGKTYGKPTGNHSVNRSNTAGIQERKGKEGLGEDQDQNRTPIPIVEKFDPSTLPVPPRRPQAHPILVALREKMGAHYDWLSSRTRATEPAQEAVIVAEVERMVGVHGKEAVINELVALGGATVSVSYVQANRNLVDRKNKREKLTETTDMEAAREAQKRKESEQWSQLFKRSPSNG